MDSPGKPQVTLMTLGHFDHGRTTLSAAISKVQADNKLAKIKSYNEIDKPEEKRENGVTIFSTTVEYETAYRHYNLIDCVGHVDIVKKMLAGPEQIDGAILVVSAPDGPGPQTREHVRLAQQAGVSKPAIVVFLNKLDQMDPEDDDMVELVELEIRDLLNEYEFGGDDIPIVRGSALKALEGDEDSVAKITELLKELENYIPTPPRAVDKFFLMPVQDTNSADRGTRVIGRITQGAVRSGNPVELVGINETRPDRVYAIEIDGKSFDEGKTGDFASLFFLGVTIADVEPGMVVANPNEIKAHTKFKAAVYFLTQEEGGYDKPISSGFRPQFYFHSAGITGKIKLPKEVEQMAPGEYKAVEVTLIVPVAMEKGLHFAIHAEERTIGVGIITEVIE